MFTLANALPRECGRRTRACVMCLQLARERIKVLVSSTPAVAGRLRVRLSSNSDSQRCSRASLAGACSMRPPRLRGRLRGNGDTDTGRQLSSLLSSLSCSSLISSHAMHSSLQASCISREVDFCLPMQIRQRQETWYTYAQEQH